MPKPPGGRSLGGSKDPVTEELWAQPVAWGAPDFAEEARPGRALWSRRGLCLFPKGNGRPSQVFK